MHDSRDAERLAGLLEEARALAAKIGRETPDGELSSMMFEVVASAKRGIRAAEVAAREAEAAE